MLSTLQNPRFFILKSPFPFKISPKTQNPSSKSNLFHFSTIKNSSPSSQILKTRHSLLNHERKAVDIAEEYLSRLKITEPTIRSFLHVSENVVKEAEGIDRKVERKEELGCLAGVLVGVKDNICTFDMPSTGGSKILDGYRPAFDATAVKKVRECGGIVFGKTNLDEFGMGSSTERSGFQEDKKDLSVFRFLHVLENVVKEAEEIDRKVERNEELGCLTRVLVGVKDNICTFDMLSTGGSRILEGYRPDFDATAVKKVKECGGIVFGKTNLDEFGVGSFTERSGFQVTSNPWDATRVPGGSSGGSAAAVSAGQCMVSLGSDTGGSVRQPASFCGVVGIKPTYGRVSRFGLMAYASSLDVIGCFSSSVVDTAILLEAISGHDRFDATSSKRKVPNLASQLVPTESLESKPLKGLRVGVICETLADGVDVGVVSAIQAAAAHLEELGMETKFQPKSLVHFYGASRANGFGSEVKMRILMGTYALSAGYYDAYYKRAQQVRTLVRESFRTALQENDVLISPAAPSAAYKIGEKKDDPLAMYAGDIMTVNVNLAGLPALVLPCGFVDSGPAGLPIGLQIIGAAFDEGNLLRVGHIFEQTLQGCRFIPPSAV
ncbi:hypothetical protein IFM89_001260 [Coptis chinensis]|uniref:Glutamyl-tRNA(Gln) amidotransferase subunit A, chloroplastic/mitochondrial n=1 Tax=Coptis chinensis TaxID=261450 RepID=A0A835H0I2_9MAGN|nr:hypothetical protein IFM89_001260 [Coptis chinensis]